MKLHDLSPPEGSNEDSVRKGRGRANGSGESCGRGNKGQKKRNTVPIYFEGGQTPIYRRFPKRGFNAHQPVEVEEVNVESLNRFEDDRTVTPEDLLETGLINSVESVKLLGNGELNTSLTVEVHDASDSAEAKVEDAGGSIKLLSSEQRSD
ncbi:MAG: 50S ribosomal protein L15 [bacterium]